MGDLTERIGLLDAYATFIKLDFLAATRPDIARACYDAAEACRVALGLPKPPPAGGMKQVEDARLEALSGLLEREGWVLVPREPTREMWAASGDAFVALDRRRRPLANHDRATQAMWTALLSAAPKP